MRWIISLGFLLFLALSGTLTAHAAVTGVDVRLEGSQEVPAVKDSATGGFAHFSLDDASRVLSWSLTVDGITPDQITGAHIHKGALGENGPIIHPLSITAASPFSAGTLQFTDSQISDFHAGRLYVNLHTAANPDGAARAQLLPRPALIALQMYAARNRGDLEGSLAFLASDISIRGGPPCNVNPCVGLAEARARFQAAISQHSVAEHTAITVEGNVVRSRVEIRQDNVRDCGISRIINNSLIEVRYGKVIRTESFADPDDPETAAFNACTSSRQAAANAVRPPSTGDAGLVRH